MRITLECDSLKPESQSDNYSWYPPKFIFVAGADGLTIKRIGLNGSDEYVLPAKAARILAKTILWVHSAAKKSSAKEGV